MRRLLLLAGVLMGLLVATSTASAGALVSVPCNRWSLASGLSGKQWVPVLGTGFFPGQALELNWSDGTLGGYTQAAANGAFGFRSFMPLAFIRAHGPHERSFVLGALDATTRAVLGGGRVRFVRFDADFQSRRRPHQITQYSLWGARAGRKVWMHFYFGGRQRRLVYMGRTNRPCGVVHKRMQVLPARSRYGVWYVYLTNSRHTLSRRARRQRHFIYRLSFTVYKIYVPRYRASAAAVR